MMKICLLSYDTPHLKTAQVLIGLHNRAFRSVDLLLMPFTPRPERSVTFRHRPFQFEGPDPRSLAAFSGGRVLDYANWRSILTDYDWFIVCGSNLIEADFANSGRILNVHAGLIPSVRRLDSFKWAILNGNPLGNTLHRIDDQADAGEIVFQLPTPIFPEDDLQTLAQRHYENEIWMLTHFDLLLQKPSILDLPQLPATKRMPLETEAEMLRTFDTYKDRHASRVVH